MQLPVVLFIAVGLSMDAFAVFLVAGRSSRSRARDQDGEPAKYEIMWSIES